MSKGKTCAPRMTAARPGSRIGSGTGSRAGIPAAALAALLLAGCSSGHVGDDWQCPLATGGSCASVAVADPAVPKADTAPARTSGQPIRLLPREWNANGVDTRPPAPRSCQADCGFDPFGWLARLFGAETGGDRPESKDARPTGTEAAPDMAAASTSGLLPADSTTSGHDDLQPDDLRTGETVARIWIAPFVDADGIYREASHVQVVLEPAGWRLK